MAIHKIGVFLLTNYFLGIYASYHWKVTENGRISSQVENSGFPLAKQDDLLAFLKQELRIQAIGKLYKQLLLSKGSIDKQWGRIEGEGDLEKRLYTTDIDCLLGKVPLSQHNLNTEFVDYGQGSRPKMKSGQKFPEPDCTTYSKLDFSMRTFPHLETLNRRGNYNFSVNRAPSNSVIDYNIDSMLKLNRSDWTAYNIAALYWRTIGNGANALECAKRALYYSARDQRYIVLLNLGTLLQDLQSLGEAAIVLHSAVDHDPMQDISHLALGNVYTALGDYNRSLACYENVLSLNPRNVRAIQLKHAILCHKKLESGLLGIHSSLQMILKDLQKHHALHEEWLHLQDQVNWDRDNKVQEFSDTPPLYLDLQMLLQNVENQAKTLKEEVIKRVTDRRKAKPEAQFVAHDLDEDLEEEEEEEEEESGIEDEDEKEEFEESDLENIIGAQYILSDKMNTLLSFIEANYEDEMSLMDFKRKISEEFRSQVSDDGPFLFEDLEACAKDSCGVRKLN